MRDLSVNLHLGGKSMSKKQKKVLVRIIAALMLLAGVMKVGVSCAQRL